MGRVGIDPRRKFADLTGVALLLRFRRRFPRGGLVLEHVDGEIQRSGVEVIATEFHIRRQMKRIRRFMKGVPNRAQKALAFLQPGNGNRQNHLKTAIV